MKNILPVVAMFTTCFTLLVYSQSFADHSKKTHHSHHPNTSNQQLIVERKYEGKPDSIYTTRLQLLVNLNEIPSISDEIRFNEQVGEKLNVSQRNLVWEKIAGELSNEIDFKLGQASFKKNNTASIRIFLEQSVSDTIIPKSDFIIASALKPYGDFGPEFRPGIPPYADFEKWNKQSGFDATQTYLLNKRPAVLVTYVIQQTTTVAGETDKQAYKDFFDRLEVRAPAPNEIVTLPDGSMVVERVTDIDRLNALYNEQSVLNIIPDLSDK